MTYRVAWMRRLLSRLLRPALAGWLLLGCAATRLAVDENHPASPKAESVPLPRVGGVLARDFEPVPDAVGPAGAGHDHSTHADRPPAQAQWTCPMHPEIVRDKPGTCPVCGMQLVPLAPKGSGGGQP